MRVLYLCHRIPYPPDKGEKIRAFHQLRALSSKHQVDVFTLAVDEAELAGQSALAEFCHSVTAVAWNRIFARFKALPYLLSRTPLTLPHFYSAELQQRIRAALSKHRYDRIFVYCSAMGQYVEHVTDIPMVVDFVDVDSDKWAQYASFTRFPWSGVYRREAWALQCYERELCEKAACILVSTEREARLVREIQPQTHVEVVSNGVDVLYFNSNAFPANHQSPTIVFTGDMAYFPNEEAVVYFARQVLPLVRVSVPDAQFLIVGRNPTQRVQDLGQAEGVVVTGFVPDVRPCLAQARVAVAPFSIAAGIQNKILEAMAFGLPVVATPKVLQGLHPKVAEAVGSAGTATEMAEQIVRLLLTPESARGIGLEGRRLVSENYRWEDAMGRLLQFTEDPTATTMYPSSVHSAAT